MGNIRELKAALLVWGLPGDPEQFDAELGSVDLDNLQAVKELVQAFRHRLVLRQTPDAMAAVMAPTAEVVAELERKMAETR
ncbi:hypothetical protein ACFZDG_35505 [Kitasatospora xanthocidica]|uniref:hypothetical protein n=1 Tax=Kitasatospora xanthocidica TaxID=83382 RepID=UPI0036ED4308